jgi:hypothetical protein
MVRFALASVAVALLLVGSLYLLVDQQVIAQYPTWWLETLLMMMLITGVVYFYLTQPQFAGARDFALMYLASIAVKLLGGCGYLVVVVLFDPEAALPNGVFFLLCYLIFTGLEVTFLWERIQSQNGVKKG